jgi:hypothetical protein
VIIVDPVTLGDAACTRPSPKWVYDRTGTLVEVPADILAVSYDPADLSKAPFAVVDLEPATNYIRNNTMQGGVIGRLGAGGVMPNNWLVGSNIGIRFWLIAKGVESGIDYVDVRIEGDATAAGFAGIYFESNTSIPALNGEVWEESAYLAVVAGSMSNVLAINLCVDEAMASGAYVGGGNGPTINPAPDSLVQGLSKYKRTLSGGSTVAYMSPHIKLFNRGAGPVDITIRIGLPQAVPNQAPDFPIKTSNGAVTRAADVIGPTAGLIYSNVPMVEPPYSAATTYAKDAAVYDPATKIVYWSMQAANVGKPLSDPAWWNKRTAINRWAMFDDRNSTVTSNPEEIVAVFSAKAITQGLFAGALDASEVRISMTHPTRGVVYSEKRSLVLPRSGSSFYGWGFNRLRMRSWFLTLKLPVFANALVTITIRRPGGVAKCGMCMIGHAIDVGLSLMGLSTELKDYSTTTFYPDGSSDTIPRGFSKRMSIDLSVERDRVESIEDDLIKRRQKTLVWLGSTLRGDTMLVGKFSSFRKVIDSYPRSKMALQIEGVLSQ